MREIRIKRGYSEEEKKEPLFEYIPEWPYISIGFGTERDYFIENLSLLIASGMGILAALDALAKTAKTIRMKKSMRTVKSMVEIGTPLWKAFEKTRMLPERTISLIRSGEEVGRLADHLNLVTVQQHKEKVFNSRLRTALLYPGIILCLAIIVALGSAWLVLPKILSVFTESSGSLPWATRTLMGIANFFEHYGAIAVPSFVALLILLVYGLFFYKRTKFIGDAILFALPGIKDLAQGIELARFGYVFGVLLQAGLHVEESLISIQKGAAYDRYKKFYNYLHDCVLHGESFKKAFAKYKKIDKYLPVTMQQLIISGEESGKLPAVFIRIGVIFEEKTDAMSRDLAVVLEPIILIIVGLIVGFIALAIYGPIYEMSNQLI